jgi:hypothetical protein
MSSGVARRMQTCNLYVTKLNHLAILHRDCTARNIVVHTTNNFKTRYLFFQEDVSTRMVIVFVCSEDMAELAVVFIHVAQYFFRLRTIYYE